MSPPAAKPKTRTRRSPAKGRKGGSGRLWAAALILAVAAVVAGIGLLTWTRTDTGQATLLSLGSDKMYAEVQGTVEQALLAVLPGLEFGPGPSLWSDSGAGADGRTSGQGGDWPAPGLGAGAAIRCRPVAVDPDIPYWSLQLKIEAALAAAGARVLWGERLYPDRPGTDQLRPNEARDLLRLDVGVTGRPTHTLVLYRAGAAPSLKWGGGAMQTAWDELAADPAPAIALVIDDWGNNKTAMTRQLLGLDIPLTLSILPGLPFSREFALQKTDLVLPRAKLLEEAGRPLAPDSGARLHRLAAGCPVEVSLARRRRAADLRRREIFLHLPMEPVGYPDPDPGPKTLMVGMDEQEIAGLVDEAMRGLPMVTGLNNHMGSAATSDPRTMAALMRVLKKRGLFFLDSLTSSGSVAYEEALRAGIPALSNRYFLDYANEDGQKIQDNLRRLEESARARGFVVGIGHPHRLTAEILAREVPRMKKAGIRFVTVSELQALQEAAARAEEEAAENEATGEGAG